MLVKDLTLGTEVITDVSDKLNRIEFSNISSTFLTENDIIDTKHIVLAENLSFIGNYTLGTKKTTTSSVWTAPKRMTLHDMLSALFTGERPDALPVVTQPTMTLTLKNVSSRVKTGTPISPGYEISFNPGKYTTTLDGNTKTQASNVLVESYSVTFNGLTLTTQSGTFNTFTPTTVGTMSMTATVTYSAGDYAKTYNDVVTEIRIEAGSKTDTKSFEVYEESYKYFIIHCNDLTEMDEITDDNIKAKAVNYYLNEPDKLETECTSKYIAMYIPKTSTRQGINIGEVGLGLSESHTSKSMKYKCFMAGAKRAFNLPINTPITYL